MAEINKIRAKHKTFTYQAYSWEILGNSNLEISFVYTIDPDISFNPKVTIHNVTQKMINQIGEKTLESYIFNLGLAEMFSYWKTTASPLIEVKAGKLSNEAIKFWHKLLINGMAEFFYQNRIEFNQENFIKIKAPLTDPQGKPNKKDSLVTPRVLVPVGGGKDSVVTLEILKQRFEVGSYTISAPQAAQDIINTAQVLSNNQLRATRILDPKLFELNKKGYLNGHVPISAYIAFLSILTAKLFGYTHIAISNERSSNEGNVWYCDQEVNHQYSKSYQFEQDFQNYVNKNIYGVTPLYFSFLRPLYELQIAQIFARFPQYHSIFRSCNRGQKQNVWCGKCSKCLFAWTILFPFIGETKLTQYFGKNLFQDSELIAIAKQLLGISKTKPFDCVGTHEETTVAFYLSIKHYNKLHQSLPPLLKTVASLLQNDPKLQAGTQGTTNFETRSKLILSNWNKQNSLPTEFVKVLKEELAKDQLNAANF